MSNKLYKGSCLCEKVQFEIRGEISNIIYCHCSLCRKAQGSAFATNGNVSKDDFVFISGEGELTAYVTGKQSKYFCKHCGSPIISKNLDFPNRVRIRVGTIDSDIDERPESHIFYHSKANWENLDEELPKFSEYQE